MYGKYYLSSDPSSTFMATDIQVDTRYDSKFEQRPMPYKLLVRVFADVNILQPTQINKSFRDYYVSPT